MKRDAAVSLLTCIGVIIGMLFGFDLRERSYREWPSGSTLLAESPLPAPTVAATEGVQSVMIVTATPEFVATVKPTATAAMAPTPVRTCTQGEGIKHEICVEPWPTPTVRVQTPIPIYPGPELATPGSTYVWQ